MCGFFGEFTAGKDLTGKEEFLSINALSLNRGPDNTGYFCNDKNLQLGFNRLSILDLSEHGNQPFHSPSGRYDFVFNGEIYNHLEIRGKLKDAGYSGTGDTATIATSLDVLGVFDTIPLLDGMFSLAIYDRMEEKLYLARDFAGIKPLFFGKKGKKLVFASQYDQVSDHPSFRSETINPAVLKIYLQNHFVPAPFGLLNNTGQVRPGEIISFSGQGGLEKTRYWEFPSSAQISITSEEEAIEKTGLALEESVKAELLSDVPVSAFLSGGIDSPLVTYYARKNRTGKIDAFSIGSDSNKHDESEDAKIYAQALDVNHHLRRMNSNEAQSILGEINNCIHEPLADMSIIPTYLVSKLAAGKFKVALSGDGGDELFFGYERFFSLLKNINFQQAPHFLKYLIYGTDRFLSRNKNFNSALLASSQGIAHQGMHSNFSGELLKEISPDLWDVEIPDELDIYSYPDSKDPVTLLNNMRKAEFYGMMQKTLRKVDLASMENSLEVRVPFLKKSFIEYSCSIHPLLNAGKGKKKDILKKLLKKNIPQAPVSDQKKGFSVPLGKWIREDLKNPFSEVLMDKELLHSLGLEPKAMETTFREHTQGNKDHKWPLFTLYALMIWKNNRNR